LTDCKSSIFPAPVRQREPELNQVAWQYVENVLHEFAADKFSVKIH